MADVQRQRSRKDELLVRQLKEGSEIAFNQLFQFYRDDIYTYSQSLLRNEALAEEVVQEVFLRLWLNAGELDPDLSLRSYLFTIARNLSFDLLRKVANNKRLTEEIFYTSTELHDGTQETLLTADYEQIKAQAIESLPPKRRLIYEMSRNQNMSYEDISRELGISISTVKNQMSKALLSLRQYLQLHTDLTFILVLVLEVFLH